MPRSLVMVCSSGLLLAVACDDGGSGAGGSVGIGGNGATGGGGSGGSAGQDCQSLKLDRHVATISHGAEQIACKILHHW